MNYDEYIDLVLRQIKTYDKRERVYQDNIIRPFLKEIFPKLDIEPTDIKTPTKIHDYEQYCGKKLDGTFGTPDLCIADEWYWNNKDNEVRYRGIVEIKSPLLDPITGFLPKNYKSHTMDEIKQYQLATKNINIILTDGITWSFYRKGNGIEPIMDPICLGKLEKKYKRGYNNRRVLERDKNGDVIVEIRFNENDAEFVRLGEELEKFLK